MSFSRGLTVAVLAILGVACGEKSEKKEKIESAPRAVPFVDESQPPVAATDGAQLDLEPWITLDLHDPALRLTANVRHPDGRIDTAVAISSRSADSTVVRVVDGALRAVRVGGVTVEVAFGDLRRRVFVVVHERIATDTVVLRPGEVRAWNLAPGTYEITVRHDERGEQPPLELVADLKCATDASRPDLIRCIVRAPTRFVLRHTGVRPTPEGARATITILRVP